jgi:hypothetical protein
MMLLIAKLFWWMLAAVVILRWLHISSVANDREAHETGNPPSTSRSPESGPSSA